MYSVDNDLDAAYPKICTITRGGDEKLRGLLEYFSNCSATSLLIDFILLKMKSNKDLLQGISKLDNIIKVSIL